MRSMLIIVLCLSSHVASTPLLLYPPNQENVIFFHGDEDAKLIPLDRSINNMKGQRGGIVVNSDGYLSQDNTTSPKELLKLIDAWLSIVIDEDHAPPLIDVFKSSAIIARFAVLKNYFREVWHPSLKSRVQAVLRKGFDVIFDADQILLATWNQFCPRPINGKEVRRVAKTFKCIFTGDKSSSYTIFISNDTDPCLSTRSKPAKGNIRTELNDVNGEMDSLAFMTSEEMTTFSTYETWTMTTETDTTSFLSILNMTTEADMTSLLYTSAFKDNIPSNSSNNSCFQLKYDSWCLTLSSMSGYLATCGRHNLFYYQGSHGNQRVYYSSANSSCLDQQSCRSNTSNLRYSSCDHCGAIHWDVKNDGTLRVDRGTKCIYITTSGRKACIHRSDLGCTSFGKVRKSC